MKKIFLACVMACIGVAAANADVFEYQPGPFDKVMIRGDFNVVYRNNPDSTGYIRYESDRDFSEKIDVTCNKGKVSVTVRLTEEEYGPLPTLYMYSDYLTGITNEGKGTFDAEVHMATPTLTLKLIGNGKIICDGVRTTDLSASLETGNGTIAVRGNCREAKFILAGSGVIQADELAANDVSCMTIGTGAIGCRPLDNLDVRGIGTTKIYYYGNPTIKKVGGAKLEQMSDKEE